MNILIAYVIDPRKVNVWVLLTQEIDLFVHLQVQYIGDGIKKIATVKNLVMSPSDCPFHKELIYLICVNM